MTKLTDNGIDYLQSQHEEEYELEAHQIGRHDRSLREVTTKYERLETLFYSQRKGHVKSVALQKAIEAIEQYMETTRKCYDKAKK